MNSYLWLIFIKSVFFRSCFSEKSPGKVLVFRGKFVPLHPLNRQVACEALGKSSLKSLHRQREVVQEAAGARPLPGSGGVALHPRVQDCEVAVDFLYGSGVVPFCLILPENRMVVLVSQTVFPFPL